MKERPILFSAPMVRAILAGSKTMTRRVVKGDVVDVDMPEWWGARRVVHAPRCQRAFCESVDDYETACGGYDCCADGRTMRSPYGGPGDRLWVREAVALNYFRPDPWLSPEKRHGYRADWTRRAEDTVPEPKWTPSIHMPRWASRITLEVTGVRVERLQDISEEDAKAEGVERSSEPFTYGWKNYGDQEGLAEMVTYHAESRDSFASLWESINGADSWAANPWVWVVAFKRLDPSSQE